MMNSASVSEAAAKRGPFHLKQAGRRALDFPGSSIKGGLTALVQP